MLIHECWTCGDEPLNVKIFATDVHRASLEMASAGRLSARRLWRNVDPERLERYFVQQSDGYHVTPELRQMIVFAPHNVIKDAPFTRLDLITCRNLLIYFQPPAQQKALSLFHFGLKTGRIAVPGAQREPGRPGRRVRLARRPLEALPQAARRPLPGRSATAVDRRLATAAPLELSNPSFAAAVRRRPLTRRPTTAARRSSCRRACWSTSGAKCCTLSAAQANS